MVNNKKKPDINHHHHHTETFHTYKDVLIQKSLLPVDVDNFIINIII